MKQRNKILCSFIVSAKSVAVRPCHCASVVLQPKPVPNTGASHSWNQNEIDGTLWPICLSGFFVGYDLS